MLVDLEMIVLCNRLVLLGLIEIDGIFCFACLAGGMARLSADSLQKVGPRFDTGD